LQEKKQKAKAKPIDQAGITKPTGTPVPN